MTIKLNLLDRSPQFILVGVVALIIGALVLIGHFFFPDLTPDQVATEWRSAQPFAMNTLAGEKTLWTLSADTTGALTMRVWEIALSYRPKTITGSDGKTYTVPSDSVAIVPTKMLAKKAWTWREVD